MNFISKLAKRYICTLLTFVFFTSPACAGGSTSEGWVTSWAASPQKVWEKNFVFPTNIPEEIHDLTIRQVVKISLGGDHFRLELSNDFGTSSFKVQDITVAIRHSEDVKKGFRNIAVVTFGGKRKATVRPGATLVSDAVSLDIPDLSEVVVSMYFPEHVIPETFHWDGRQTSFVAEGKHSLVDDIMGEVSESTARFSLSAFHINRPEGRTIAVIGDSITDGATASLDKNTRWTDFLAHRLYTQNIAVINAGISGARLLSDGMGGNALSRFSRDVLSKPGVDRVIVLLGINDIAWPGTLFAPDSLIPPLEALQDGFSQLVQQAHLRGIKVTGATLPPFKGALEGTPLEGYYNEDKERRRQALNQWIRNSGAFDSIIDFDKVLQSPDDPKRMATGYDSGDHLHPGDRGNEAMAEAIPLTSLL